MKPGPKREPESIRSYGRAVIGIDVPTREALKQLAGDMPMSHYVRALAQRELERTGKGQALPGMGKSVSSTSLSSISESLKELGNRMNRLEASIVVGLGLAHREYDAAGNITGAARNDWDSDAPHLVIKEYLRRVRDTLNAQQLSFNDGEANA